MSTIAGAEVRVTGQGAAPRYVPPSNVTSTLDALRAHKDWELTITEPLFAQLHAHLFPGDHDEHGAVLLVGVSETPNGARLLVREMLLAKDGVDYVRGQRGYRMLTGRFVARAAARARDERLAYLAVHNHRGTDQVAFSDDDLASHRRGYPALLDIVDGLPVGALVFAENAVAGSLWLGPETQRQLRQLTVLGMPQQRLFPSPPARAPEREEEYDRQARIFGDRGQALLSQLTVGVIGAGGIGSLIIELLARLGVSHFIIIDPDVISTTNVPRITGSSYFDARSWLTAAGRPQWMRRLGERFATPKVTHMRRLIHKANKRAKVEALRADVTEDATARLLRSCDYIFLAADSMQARHTFNALVHAFLIPGVQVGVKVPVDTENGLVGDIFSTSRSVLPGSGCLLCNGLVTAAGLQREAETAAERTLQRYVEEKDVLAPSVITLNAFAAAIATNDFLFSLTGLTDAAAHRGYITYHPRQRLIKRISPRRDEGCVHCGAGSVSLLARGDEADLPTKIG